MKILELRAENFKRLRAVTIRPDGAMVQVTGKNGEGKTSSLDAIWAALKGRAAGIVEPVRKGQQKAVIKLDIGEYVILRTFERTADGDVTVKLKVTQADGAEVRKSPQAVIDGLIGGLSLDPLAFVRLKPEEQFDVLKSFVKDFNFDDNATKRKKAFETRTDVNRRMHQAQAAAATVQLPEGSKPKPVDVSERIDEMERAARRNAGIAEEERQRAGARTRIEAKLDEAERLRARAATLEAEAAAETKALDGYDPLPPAIDISALRAEIATAEATAKTIALFEKREAHELEATTQKEIADKLTAEIDALDEAKKTAIESAAMPVEGLTLGDGIVLYKNVPFASASRAEKLVVSTSIAMAQNPELRIIRCYEGSSLDSKSLGVLAAMAKTRDWQVWLERVDESGEVGFVIENGEVVSS